jgi:hypothetical protein
VDLSNSKHESEHTGQDITTTETGSPSPGGVSGGRIKYGSRKIFFRRVWARLHGEVSPEVAEMGVPTIGAANEQSKIAKDNVDAEQSNDTLMPPPSLPESDSKQDLDIPIPWERVIGEDNQVVNFATDRGLISDAQLAAIAQMSLCHLTEADRIGWFKNRAVGFGGLCCKHCGGRPSFGRYFPNSVRSFAQTTSSQTIISHIALYCPKCPKDIRDIVMQLQRKENSIAGTVSLSNSNYGSRKVFFDRVWSRMHPSTDATLSDVVVPTTDTASGGTSTNVQSSSIKAEPSEISDVVKVTDISDSTTSNISTMTDNINESLPPAKSKCISTITCSNKRLKTTVTSESTTV